MPSHAVLKTMIMCVSVCSTTSYLRKDCVADGQSEIRVLTSVAAAPMTAKVTDCS